MARIIITLSTPLFCFFFSLLHHQTMSQPQHMYTFCNPIQNFTTSSPYKANRDTLLSSLRNSSSLATYSNLTIGLSPDTVHGMFLCRGDISTLSCSNCIQTATMEVATNCSLNKEAFIYYEECMVRYSNISFLSKLEVRPSIVLYSVGSVPNLNRLNQTLFDKFNQLILNVSLSSSVPYFLKNQERVNQSEGSYELESMVQCSPDLDPLNCTVCLRVSLLRVSTCCGLPTFAQIFTPKCLLRFETSVLPSPPLSPSSPPPLSSPPPPPLSLPPKSSPSPSLPQAPPPPPLLFTPPSPSGSYSINIIKGNVILGRIVVTMTALVFVIVGM